MRRFLMVVAVLAVIAVLCVGSVAQPPPPCTRSKTTISLYPGCRQLVQLGQQDCFIAKVYEYYPTGGLGVDNGGIVFFIDNNTGSVLGAANLSSYGYAVGCFKIKFDVDVYAAFIALYANGTP